MNNIYKSIIAACFILSTFSVQAQKTDTTLIVNGVCGMCERIIEKAALIKGVSVADWDVDTKILKLSYNQEKVKLAEINKSIIASGYDTEMETASDEAYNKLHGCCHYRDPEVVKDHEAEKEPKK